MSHRGRTGQVFSHYFKSLLRGCIAGIKTPIRDNNTVITVVRVVKYAVEHAGDLMAGRIPGSDSERTMAAIGWLGVIIGAIPQVIPYIGKVEQIRLIDMDRVEDVDLQLAGIIALFIKTCQRNNIVDVEPDACY